MKKKSTSTKFQNARVFPLHSLECEPKPLGQPHSKDFVCPNFAAKQFKELHVYCRIAAPVTLNLVLYPDCLSSFVSAN